MGWSTSGSALTSEKKVKEKVIVSWLVGFCLFLFGFGFKCNKSLVSPRPARWACTDEKFHFSGEYPSALGGVAAKSCRGGGRARLGARNIEMLLLSFGAFTFSCSSRRGLTDAAGTGMKRTRDGKGTSQMLCRLAEQGGLKHCSLLAPGSRGSWHGHSALSWQETSQQDGWKMLILKKSKCSVGNMWIFQRFFLWCKAGGFPRWSCLVCEAELGPGALREPRHCSPCWNTKDGSWQGRMRGKCSGFRP